MKRKITASASTGFTAGGTSRDRSRTASAAKRPAQSADMAGTAATPVAPIPVTHIAAAGPSPRLDPPPAILIEIDPAPLAGYARNRYDLTLRGRAVSLAAIEEIRLEVDGQIYAKLSLGEPERAAVVQTLDGREFRQRPFHFKLPRLAEMQPEIVSCAIIARTDGGVEHAETFRFDIDPAAGAPVRVLIGPTRPAANFDGANPFAIVYIERGTIDTDGNIAVEGWVVALGPVLAVNIFAGSARIGAATMGGERADVGAAFPSYRNARQAGFSLTGYLTGDDLRPRTIRAEVVCSNGFAIEECIPVEFIDISPSPASAAAACEPATAPDSHAFGLAVLNPAPAYRLTAGFHLTDAPLPIFGLPAPVQDTSTPAPIKMFCDAAELHSDGFLFVDGWAVCAAGIAQVRILLDDQPVGLAVFGHERADVGALYADIPTANLSGFRFETNLGQAFLGEHTIRVVVRNARNDVQEETLAVQTRAVETGAVAVLGAPEAAPPEEAEPSAEQAAEFRFELDSPTLAGGVAVDTVTGRLTIDGWLLSRSGVATFEAFLDDQRLGDVHYGLARQDVGAAFPEWPDSLRSGYAFHCPPRSLKDGTHTVRLTFRSKNGQAMSRQFQITVRKSEDHQDFAGIRQRVPRAEVDLMLDLLADLDYHPAYRFILRHTGRADPKPLRATLDALCGQAFADWSALLLADDADTAAALSAMIQDLFPRLIPTRTETAAPAMTGAPVSSPIGMTDRFTVISAGDDAWHAPLADDADTLYALLRTGDELGADALLEFAVAGGMHRDADMLYADEVRESPVTREREAFFKPDFSPDLLFSTNYIGRPWVVAGSLLAGTGATPASLAADGEYDLVLRCATAASRVVHLPKLLCQRGVQDLDDPAQEEAALRRVLDQRAIAATVLPTPVPGTWRVRRAVPAKPKVSIIIPTCAMNGYIETCLNTLRLRTAWPDYEIIIVDNIPDHMLAWKVWVQQNADKVVDIPGGFNWSIFNNRAAEVADGEYLLFLNDDIEITHDDWLDAMMEHAQRPEVGITGPQLLYPNGKVQHAGMFLATTGVGRHAFRFSAGNDPGYFGLALTQRNVMAVTGACMLVRTTVFEAGGRFDEAHEIVNNDLDFCLRVHQAGLLTVFTPYASLIHHELASRAQYKDVFDMPHFTRLWKTVFAAGDPYFNPRLSRHNDDFRPDDEPVQWITPGAPLFHATQVQRILVVKLDHIGDFVTALAPIRRLKQIFPHARITVLAGPASRALASLEPCIDEFIPFSFFHARSQLGERKLELAELNALREQLRPYQFDLAVDLRKHLSTRDILKYTGARLLAGFDFLGQFPYLDIALDWDGDRTLQRKRSHVIDDLMALVNAIGHASESNRALMRPIPPAMPIADLPAPVRGLFAKTVIAVHPGAGNVTKQWPPDHFAALIDLLVERQDVNILLIGGPDEVEVADTLLANALYPDRVASMTGQTSLADLPGVLLNCGLYIGNDSGPKHIAAAIGMPVIGIHSGVVDPVEWGPLGPRAIALRRNMTCSPCYLANAEDCPRALACLRFLEPNLVYEAAVMLMKRTVVTTKQAKAKSRRRQPAVQPA